MRLRLVGVVPVLVLVVVLFVVVAVLCGCFCGCVRGCGFVYRGVCVCVLKYLKDGKEFIDGWC